jgi:hypothetical protein
MMSERTHLGVSCRLATVQRSTITLHHAQTTNFVRRHVRAAICALKPGRHERTRRIWCILCVLCGGSAPRQPRPAQGCDM